MVKLEDFTVGEIKKMVSKYNKQVKKLGYLSFVGVEGEEAQIDKFCNNDVCEIGFVVEEISE